MYGKEYLIKHELTDSLISVTFIEEMQDQIFGLLKKSHFNFYKNI
jgi:hypothetical protein